MTDDRNGKRLAFEAAAADSRWWLDAWWEEENWLSQSRFSLEEVRSSIEVLKTVFTAEWAEKIGANDVANIFLRNIRYGKSVWQHRYIIELGRQIEILRELPGFASVQSRLLSINDSESADMELALAAILLSNSFDIEFPVPKSKRGKSPDIVASCGNEKVAFECKQLEVSNKQRWLDTYYNHASQLLRNGLDNAERHVQFEFEEPPVDRYFDRDGKAVLDATAVAEEVSKRMISFVRSMFVESSSPLLFGIEEIGYGRFVSTSVPDSAWTRLPSMSDDRLFARLYANGIARASEQLRTVEFPGIAAIYAERSPSLEYSQSKFETIVRKEPSRYAHLVACLVFQRQALFDYRPPFLLVNPASNVKFAQLRVSEVIRRAFRFEAVANRGE